MIERIKEWRGVGLFLAFAAILAFWVANSNSHQQAVDARQQEIIKALARDNFEAIQRNGNFQTCVWRSLIRPHVAGNTKLARRAIRQCDHRYLQGQDETQVLSEVVRASPKSLINQKRVNNGCKPLKSARTELRDSARRWSKKMARDGYLSHSTLNATGWSKVGEVVGVGPTWRSIVRALFHSKPHRQILLDCDYDVIAIGVIYRDFVWLTARLYAR